MKILRLSKYEEELDELKSVRSRIEEEMDDFQLHLRRRVEGWLGQLNGMTEGRQKEELEDKIIAAASVIYAIADLREKLKNLLGPS